MTIVYNSSNLHMQVSVASRYGTSSPEIKHSGLLAREFAEKLLDSVLEAPDSPRAQAIQARFAGLIQSYAELVPTVAEQLAAASRELEILYPAAVVSA